MSETPPTNQTGALSPDGHWRWDGAHWVLAGVRTQTTTAPNRGRLHKSIAVVGLFFCLPIGMVLVWYTTWSRNVKLVLTGAGFCLLLLGGIVSAIR